jgi:hypothetical protein
MALNPSKAFDLSHRFFCEHFISASMEILDASAARAYYMMMIMLCISDLVARPSLSQIDFANEPGLRESFDDSIDSYLVDGRESFRDFLDGPRIFRFLQMREKRNTWFRCTEASLSYKFGSLFLHLIMLI